MREHDYDDSNDGDDDDDTDIGQNRRRPNTGKVDRRIGQTGARVSYRLTRPNRKMPVLFPTAEKVYRHLQKRNAPQTAKDIERATKLPMKTVESCLYHLRHAGLVKSELL